MAKIVTTLPEAKARAKRAHQAARAGDTVSAAIYDRWLATTLSAAAGQDPAIAATMFTRLAIALEGDDRYAGMAGRDCGRAHGAAAGFKAPRWRLKFALPVLARFDP